MTQSVTNTIYRTAWSLGEISVSTGLSVNFLRYEVQLGNLAARKFGRRILIRDEDLRQYLESGSEGGSSSAMSAAALKKCEP